MKILIYILIIGVLLFSGCTPESSSYDEMECRTAQDCIDAGKCDPEKSPECECAYGKCYQGIVEYPG